MRTRMIKLPCHSHWCSDGVESQAGISQLEVKKIAPLFTILVILFDRARRLFSPANMEETVSLRETHEPLSELADHSGTP